MNTTYDLYLYHEHHHAKAYSDSMTHLNEQLDDFLRQQQKQAFTIALVSLKHEADALDVVQETMFSFVKYYRRKSVIEWKPLFYRVLNNKINDHHRRKKGWLNYFFGGKDSDDIISVQADDKPSPDEVFATQTMGNEMIKMLQQLPAKQLQVMLYRHWQQLSVDETAKIMNISNGSVKTHLFRATKKLQRLSGEQHDRTTH